jgi:simple sugar transport system permease protein
MIPAGAATERGEGTCDHLEAILSPSSTASTPLLIASIGELVTERAGVLNLGVEGMMVMGAVCSFAGAVTFDSTILGVLCGILAGVLMAALFALVALGFAANQVGSGLALTIFGLGLSGLIGAPFVGARRDPVGALNVPGLTTCRSSGGCCSGRTPSSTPPWR